MIVLITTALFLVLALNVFNILLLNEERAGMDDKIKRKCR